jgi:signal transduction histidine kinase
MTFLRPTRRAPDPATVGRVNLLRRLLTHEMRPIDLLVFDFLTAVAVAAICVAAALEAPLHGGPHEPVWVSVLVGLVIAAPLMVRHHRPVLVTVVVTAFSSIALISRVVPDYSSAGPALAIAVAAYALGLLAPARQALVTAGGCLLPATIALAIAADDLWSSVGAIGLAGVIIVPPWLVGRMVRERRESATRYRLQLVREAATEERLRLARDLHDVVGHSMSLIAVNASIAVHVAADRPEAALEALRVIEQTSRDALEETRSLLGMLREDSEAVMPVHAGDLRALVDRTSAAGVAVRLEAQPDVLDRVSGKVARAVYLIVQEALTNVVKHAAPAECRASVTVDDQDVRVEVVDNGTRTVRTARPGNGLIGMRERAGLNGGTFSAGPRPEGGFGVSAQMPRRGVA